MKKIETFLLYLLLSQCCLAQHWDSLGTLNKHPTVLYNDSVTNKLYVGGIFTRVNNQIICGIASWNGNNLDSVGHGIGYDSLINHNVGNTWGIVRYGNYIYAGGTFSETGFSNTPFLARWNGLDWDSVPGGRPNDVVENLLIDNNELYVLGVFDSIGNVSAHGIAKWNGINWQSVGNNYNFNNSGMGIFDAAFYNGNLYVSGDFKDASGNYCRLAKWNGSNWQFMTNDIAGPIGGINDMVVYNNQLYVAGLFFAASGNEGTSIMRWNDTIWQDVGGSIQVLINANPAVYDMNVNSGKLFCVGNFEMIGGIPAKGIASWNGFQWCGYNTDFISSSQYCGASVIEFYNDTMYVGGGFGMVDGLNIPYIAKWTGGNYVDSCGFVSTGIDQPEINEFSISVFPNPSTTISTFQFTGLEGTKTLTIYNQLGKEIWKKETTENQIEFPAENFAAGLYFYSLEQKGEVSANGKFIIR